MPPPAAPPAEMQLRQACAEMERRLQTGEPCRAEDLLAAHPGVTADEECVIDLIYTEYVLRQRLGQQPAQHDWFRRFPQYEEQLRRVFRFHELLGGNSPPPSTNVSRLTPPGGGGLFTAPPRQLGKHELLGEIGRGGMGVVYRARHRELDRLVAVKLILAGELASAEDLARFRTEAQAAASLQHPNIVQVFEVGEDSGQHYLSLEYVDGPSLEKQLADALLPAHDAAQLVETLAHAMQHAHERGIVHRDLKPANVLLQTTDNTDNTDKGEGSFSVCVSVLSVSSVVSFSPKIADFGLAKRLHTDDGQTRTNAIVGTPSYMAPEQTAKSWGEVGPAADIYALGAILYECLTGRPPFKGESAMDTLLQVRHQEPIPPSRLRLSVPRDLETICLKCLQKEPAKRYASAAALADDLAAWREGRPIRARRTPAWERGVKWARRRPAAAGLLAVSLVFLASAMGGTILYIAALEDAVRKVKAEQQQTDLSIQRGTEVVDGVLEHLATSGLTHMPGGDKFVQQLLEKALEYRMGFLSQRGTDPTLRERVGRAYRQVGNIYLMLRRDEAAEQTLLHSVTYFKELVAEYPAELDCKQQLALSLHNLAELLAKLPDRQKQATEAYQQAAAQQQELIAARAAERRYRQDLARHHYGLGALLHRGRDLKGAKHYYHDALRLREDLAREASHVEDYPHELAQSHHELAMLQIDLKQFNEADQNLRKALQLMDPLVKKVPTLPEYRETVARTLTNRGNLLKILKSSETEKHYRRALEYREGLVQDYSERPLYRHQLAITLMQLGNLLLENKERRAEAEEVLRQALKHRQTLAHVYAQMSENHHYLGLVCHKLAEMEVQRRRPAEAAALLRLAIHHQGLAVRADPQLAWTVYLRRHRAFLGSLIPMRLVGVRGW